MSNIVPEPIEEYARAHTAAESSLLQELAHETRHKMKRAEMLIGQVEGALLRLLVEVSQARRILEIGTFTGYSALTMAEALPPDGRVLTCDVDPEATTLARRFWARSAHGSKIELHLGPALEVVGDLEGPFDLVFIDADKANYIAYWELCVPKVRTGGLLVIDNTLKDGRVLAPESPADHAVVAFNAHARADNRVEAVILTVRDGVTLARKL
jgi:caffeoyl-CoA O-methyltransferase